MPTAFPYVRFSHKDGLAGTTEREQIDRILTFHHDKLAHIPLFRGANPDLPFDECTDRAVSAFSHRFKNRKAGGFVYNSVSPGDHIIVGYYDRAFRIASDGLWTVEKWLKRGIIAHFVNLELDISSAAGFILFGISAVIAQGDSMSKSERIKSNRALRRKYDLQISGPQKRLPGFKAVHIKNKDLKTDDHQLRFDETTLPYLKRCKDLIDSGRTEVSIETELTHERAREMGCAIRPMAFMDDKCKVYFDAIKTAALVWEFVQPFLVSKAHISYYECQKYVRENRKRKAS